VHTQYSIPNILDNQSRIQRRGNNARVKMRLIERLRCRLVAIVAGISLLGASCAWSESPTPNSAAALRAKYTAMQDRLRSNPFQRPIYVESGEESDDQKGDIYAIVDYPIAELSSALREPANWTSSCVLDGDDGASGALDDWDTKMPLLVPANITPAP
jgi:hypothetical protein